MELSGKNFIAGNLSAKGTTTFTAENPADESTLPTSFYEATKEEIDEAIKGANEAFAIYGKKSGKEKAGFLEAIADEILALGDDLIDRCCAESGLPAGRITGERGRTMNQLKLFASLLRDGSWVDARIDTAIPDREPAPKPDVRSMQKALGPVGVFGASNFPLAFSVAGGDTASALAAGCSIIVKAHPSHPGTCELVGTAIQKAAEKTNMPKAVFSMVHGRSIEVGQAIVNHPLIKAVGFTGSYNGGKSLFDAANKRPEPIPVYAEMGSTNPVFLLPNALKERNEELAKGFTGSVTLGVGQFCTNPGLVFVQKSDEAASFVKNTIENFQETEAGPMLNKNIKSSYVKAVQSLRDQENVVVLTQGKENGKGNFGTPYLFETTASEFIKNDHLEDEVFGPATISITADSKEDLIKAAKRMRGHLTASLFGTEEDLKNHQDLIEILEQKVGRIIFNAFPTGVEVCHSMVHGGPFPATTDSRSTSVGTGAITRFTRPFCYQGFPQALLPDELKDNNPLGIFRLVDGERKK